jgi:glycosyltransferase involved in cell wall biosynthesis
MKLGFDGRVFCHEKVTGVERYARELYQKFDELDDVELFMPQTHSRYTQHLWVQTRLPLEALRSEVDLLFCPVLAAPIMLNKQIPLVVTVPDLAFLRFPDMYSWAFRTYYHLLMPWVLRRANLVLTISHTEQCNIIEQFPFVENKIETVHLGVAEHFYARGQEREPIILAVGSTNKHKNLASLLYAFALITTLIPHRLVIVGGSRSIISADPRIGEAMKNIPEGRVSLTGYVSDDELVDWYNRADLFVFPSLFEGFGLPPLEAMACGCPVIVSNRSCLPEVCGDAATYCDPEDFTEMARIIAELSADEPKKRAMSEQGLRHAAAYTWKRTAEQTMSAFRKVL